MHANSQWQCCRSDFCTTLPSSTHCDGAKQTETHKAKQPAKISEPRDRPVRRLSAKYFWKKNVRENKTTWQVLAAAGSWSSHRCRWVVCIQGWKPMCCDKKMHSLKKFWFLLLHRAVYALIIHSSNSFIHYEITLLINLIFSVMLAARLLKSFYQLGWSTASVQTEISQQQITVSFCTFIALRARGPRVAFVQSGAAR